MLQLDACAILALGNEAHFHFRFQIRSWRKSALICQESTSREGGFHRAHSPNHKCSRHRRARANGPDTRLDQRVYRPGLADAVSLTTADVNTASARKRGRAGRP